MSQINSPSCLGSEWIGRRVLAIIDRPLGTRHPRWPEILYRINYGHIPETLSGDGEPVDVYIVGEDRALDQISAYVVAIVHREDDNEDKLVAAVSMNGITPDAIMEQVQFVEKYFRVTIETPCGWKRYDCGIASIS